MSYYFIMDRSCIPKLSYQENAADLHSAGRVT